MKTCTRLLAIAVVALFPGFVSATNLAAVTCGSVPNQATTQYNTNVQCSVQVTEGVQGQWYNAFQQDCNNFCPSIGLANTASPDGFRCTSGEERPWSAIEAGVNYSPTGCWHPCAAPEGLVGGRSEGFRCYHPAQKRDHDVTDITVGCFCGRTTAAPQAQLGIDIDPSNATKLSGVSGTPANWESVSTFTVNDLPTRIFNLFGIVGYGRSASLSMNINVQGACGTSTSFTAVLARADGTFQNRQFFITLPACPPIPACADGLDNDGDGAVDLADFSCSSGTDPDEGNPKAQCQDGSDNDGDNLVDLADPGCSSAQDNNEADGTTACQDGIDNDGDGAIDFPNDFSCSAPTDNNEADPVSQCQNGVDNDGDGATDFPNDFSCASRQDNDETNPRAQCQDGLDNDSDGLIDSNDPACTSSQVNNEGSATSQCQDGIDNDADGTADFPGDFGCSGPTDNDESNPRSQCQDGVDNDGDGAVDFPADFSCQSAQDNDELSPRSQCQDGVDNDTDGLTDLADPGCSGGQDNTEDGEAASLAVGVECVLDNTDGTKTAYFSYNNVTAQALTVPIGSSGSLVNAFSPGLLDQGQPTSFVPGVAKGVVGVALTGSNVTWTVRASGSSVSTATATATGPKCAAVQPLIECQGYESGELRALSGYQNPNPFEVKIGLGSLNFFNPSPIDKGQPTLFKTGLNRGSFEVVLTDPATPLVWDLNGQKVTASTGLPVCSGECIDTAVGAIRSELDDLAVQIADLTIDAAGVLASVPEVGAAAANTKAQRRRRRASAAKNRVDAERAKAKAQSYVAQSKALTIQFPDVIKNCPEAPQFCETVDRGPTIDQLRVLFAEARNTAQRTMARAYFKQTGATNRRDALVRQAKQLEMQGIADLDKLPRTETVCK